MNNSFKNRVENLIKEKGFNPKIKLVRDKTLMQGHEYCNHRYIWTG
jgi:hypothetical protein